MTTKIVNHHTKDDAVSPVVGVMLMLVVTIVIAAVVALFATSVVTDTNAAPVAVIQMDAYSGDTDELDTLNMSIIGGKALELSKLKCVVTVEDGKYGMVFKSLDTDPLVGKFLEIGENLEIFNFSTTTYTDDGMRKINSLVGGDIKSEADRKLIYEKIHSEWEVGNKVNVMIVFDENAILYKRDIIIQQNMGYKITPDPSLENGTISIVEKDGSEVATITPDEGFAVKAGTVQVLNAVTGDDQSSELNLTQVSNGDPQKWMFDKPLNSVIVTCEFEEEAAAEDFNVLLGNGLLMEGESITVSNGTDELSYTATEEQTKDIKLGKIKLSEGSNVTITINLKDKVNENFVMHALSNWDDGVKLTKDDTGYIYTITYTVDKDDFGNDEVYGTNPITIWYETAGYIPVTLIPVTGGTWDLTKAFVSNNHSITVKEGKKEGTFSLYDSDKSSVLATFTLTTPASQTVKSAKFGTIEILKQTTAVTTKGNLTLTVETST